MTIVSMMLAMALSWSAAPPEAADAGLPTVCSIAALGADLSACDQAIVTEKDVHLKARMLHRRAYALDERHRYEEAVKDLDAALVLEPDFADALHERAYALGELSEYARAVRDLDREIALRPTRFEAYQERAFARHHAGDLAGAWADRDRAVTMRPKEPAPLLARAEAAAWLGHFDEATRDVAAAESLARQADDSAALQWVEKLRKKLAMVAARSTGSTPDEKCSKADKTGKFDTPNVIGDCTAAFLATADNRKKADFLTARSIAWLITLQDEDASASDRQVAAALDPDNPDRHANLGFAYLSVHHSWAAEREFNRAFASRFS